MLLLENLLLGLIVRDSVDALQLFSIEGLPCLMVEKKII